MTAASRQLEIALASWPKFLRKPGELNRALKNRTQIRVIQSPLSSKLVLQFVGSWAYLLANVLNRSRIYNHETFKQALRKHEINNLQSANLTVQDELVSRNASAREESSSRGPLLTYSNHLSCIDDPILWAVLLPFNYYFTNTDTVRWTAAAVDICFTNPWHSAFFSLGKTFPIIRGVGLNQPAMDYAQALLNLNQWLHLFPEGRVMRNDKQEVISNIDRGYMFKWGIAKLILDYLNSVSPRSRHDSEISVLPFYHLGMDRVLPIGRPYVPRTGNRITVYIRPSVIKMNSNKLNRILDSRSLSAGTAKSKSNDEITRIKLTNYLEDELEKLIEPAGRAHVEAGEQDFRG